MVRLGEPLEIDGMEAALAGIIRHCGDRVVVAFSGGVDSSVVAVAATRVLGAENVLCVAAHSESNTAEDIELCRSVAAAHRLSLEIVEYSELEIAHYAENPANRCYFCKNELYERLGRLAEERGFGAVLDGSNLDDGGDYRPGLKAVAEHAVRSPLREARLGKEAVRALARHFGLPNHDKPSSPCLSSRVPYGDRITREKLEQIGAAERFLRGLGLGEFRCRHHGAVARVETDPAQFQIVLQNRQAIVDEFRRLGFLWVALDLGGFRSGNLNAALPGVDAHPGNREAPGP